MGRKTPKHYYDSRYVRLLKMAPFERRRGGWRFGTNQISDAVIERLLEAGRAIRDGDRVMLPRKAHVVTAAVEGDVTQRRCRLPEPAEAE